MLFSQKHSHDALPRSECRRSMQLCAGESKATLIRGSHDSFRAHKDTHSETARHNKLRYNRKLQSVYNKMDITHTHSHKLCSAHQFNEPERQLLIPSKQVYTDNIIKEDYHKFMRFTVSLNQTFESWYKI